MSDVVSGKSVCAMLSLARGRRGDPDQGCLAMLVQGKEVMKYRGTGRQERKERKRR